MADFYFITMEEKKKLDVSQLIGFALIGAVFVWYTLTQKDKAPEKETTEVVTGQSTQENLTDIYNVENDSIVNAKAIQKYGQFAYALATGTSEAGTTVLENEVLKLTIANKGGQIVEAQLKNYTTYNKAPLYLIKDANANFNINFNTLDNKTIQTKDLVFEPNVSTNGGNKLASFKLKVANNKYLEYRYELKPSDYMLNFSIRSVGLENVISSNNSINLNWDYTARRQEKSVKYENQMTALHYEKEDGKFDDLSVGSKDDETEEDVNWIGYKQHFFSTILTTDTAFEKAELTSESLVKDPMVDTLATKKFSTVAPLKLTNGALSYNMGLYIGPNIHDQLKSYDKGIENVMNLGWGIFGWINKVVFIPIFHLLSSFMSNYGLVIILMTLVVRLLMSPLVYKSYVSSAKMKVLKPEMDAINAKFPGKENQMKRQSEVMALQRKSGVNMMAGCVPALLQMPVFFALFRFFPSEIDLRQKPFLWADDLSSYDSVIEWTTNIPVISNFYGNHFSLFPVLASVAIFFYMKMNQGQQMGMQQQPTQEGMPDMQKMMKMMMYFSPLMMLFFFNNYASGLSLYYFISNLLTLTIMFVIKNYVIDEEKILAKIHENRKKPKKQSKFKQRLDDAMKQAQAQQAQQKKKK